MLLALRSLWESAGATIRKGAGLLLALQSLVEEQVGSSDVVFPVTGVAGDPHIGDIAEVAIEISSGGIFPLRIAQQLEEERKRKRNFVFEILRGVAADPQIGEIADVDVSIPVGQVSNLPSSQVGNLRHFDIDFSVRGAPLANAYPGNIRGSRVDFRIIEGTAASPVINNPKLIETAFDLLEEEWLMLFAAA